MYIAGIIFIIAYVFIATEKVHKTLVALFGASLMLVFHVLSQDQAFHHIDFNVIFLLVSMMVLVKVIEQTGIFEYIAIKLAKMVKGEPFAILLVLFFLTAIFSAILDNITTVLLIAPLSILLARELRITPIPFLLAQIFASNIGGTATLIGDPPNIMIGSAAGLSFMDFIINVAPLILIEMPIIALLMFLIFRKKMKVSNQDQARIMALDEKRLIKNPKLLKKSIFVLLGVIIGFVIHGFVDLEAATIALTGASLLIIMGSIDPDEIFKKVEWSSIFFFIGLFIMVGGLVETGVIGLLSNKMLTVTQGDVFKTAKVMIWFSGVFSAIVDNIPFVATMIPLIQDMGVQLGTQDISPVWWALSLGSCLGGNGTLIGASANIIVVSMAKKAGHKISFLSFLLYSIPVFLITIAMAYVYLILRYF
jgi:Na+/H+ antiporter NhaD/arsenite permease-like protein